MSNMDIQPEAETRRARQVRLAAAAWLEKRERGNWTSGDQQDFDAWLSLAMTHRVAYWRVVDAWSRTDRLNALGPPMAQPRQRLRESRLIPQLIRFGAAAVAVAAVVGAATLYIGQPAAQTYKTTLGGRETLAFSDGTEVDLNTDTVLRTSMTAEHRYVWLDKGEAYFRVKHDAAHPFVVFAGGHKVVDLGTRFIVRRENQRLEVSLVEGRAEVVPSEAGGTSQTLKPGDVLVATADKTSIVRKSPEVLSDELGWQRGVIVFRHTTLADAANQFNRYSAHKLVIADEKIARLTVVGTFRANDMPSFVDVARTIFGLKVARRGDETILTP